MSAYHAIPWLIDDGRRVHTVTLDGDVDLETREVRNLRATCDRTGREVEIPPDALSMARADLIEFAEDAGRIPW